MLIGWFGVSLHINGYLVVLIRDTQRYSDPVGRTTTYWSHWVSRGVIEDVKMREIGTSHPPIGFIF